MSKRISVASCFFCSNALAFSVSQKEEFLFLSLSSNKGKSSCWSVNKNPIFFLAPLIIIKLRHRNPWLPSNLISFHLQHLTQQVSLSANRGKVSVAKVSPRFYLLTARFLPFQNCLTASRRVRDSDAHPEVPMCSWIT